MGGRRFVLVIEAKGEGDAQSRLKHLWRTWKFKCLSAVEDIEGQA